MSTDVRAKARKAISDAYYEARNAGGTMETAADAAADAVTAIAAEVLRDAARHFEYDMAKAWGGDARWISTGSHVADLVADVLRERAFELTDGGES